MEYDKNEYNCTDIYPSEVFFIVCNESGNNSDNSREKGENS